MGRLRQYAIDHGIDWLTDWIGREPTPTPPASPGVRGLAPLPVPLPGTQAPASTRLTPAQVARRRRRRAERRLALALAAAVAPVLAETLREAVARDTVAIAARLVQTALTGKRT